MSCRRRRWVPRIIVCRSLAIKGLQHATNAVLDRGSGKLRKKLRGLLPVRQRVRKRHD